MGPVRTVVVVACVLAAVMAPRTGSAAWVDMGLSNGTMDTPGAYGYLGGSVALTAYYGDQDYDYITGGGLLLDGWRALGGKSNGTATTTTGGDNRILIERQTSIVGKNQYGFVVHDSLQKPDNSYWTIGSEIYRVDFNAEAKTYMYKSGALIYWGDTDIYGSWTWQSANGYWPGGSNVAVEWFDFGAAVGVDQHFALFWNNTGDAGWTPTAEDLIGVDHHTVITTTDSFLGQHIRFGAYGTQYGNTGGIYLDDVSMSYWAVTEEIPEPATVSLVLIGALGVLVRRRRH